MIDRVNYSKPVDNAFNSVGRTDLNNMNCAQMVKIKMLAVYGIRTRFMIISNELRHDYMLFKLNEILSQIILRLGRPSLKILPSSYIIRRRVGEIQKLIPLPTAHHPPERTSEVGIEPQTGLI